MLFFTRFYRSNFMIRLRSWEYWPFGIVQFPLFIYFAWLAIKSRSVTFFSSSNPGILMGGMFGESKFDVLSKIPAGYKPITILITTTTVLQQALSDAGLSFPVIAKPDIGERGFMVKKIGNLKALEEYRAAFGNNFIVQELVDLPLEFGVFYSRLPSEEKGHVTSVVMKEMLSITGDGVSTLKQLILGKDRAKLQWNKLKLIYADALHTVIPKGEKKEIVSIGNHCLGTTFLNGNHLITPVLHNTFDGISKSIDGFYFGRFDLRCGSIEDLYTGNIKILELNGCGAEPAHIYHPGFSLREALSVLFRHWNTIYRIAAENHKLGFHYISYAEAMGHYRNFKRLVR